MASRRSHAPTYVRFIDKMPCIFDKKPCFIFWDYGFVWFVWGYALALAVFRKISQIRNICHNICIPNAQYSSLSAQQNLRCEIFEFWACKDKRFIHSELESLWGECAKKKKQQEACFCCNSATFTLQKCHFYHAIAPLLHSNSATIVV